MDLKLEINQKIIKEHSPIPLRRIFDDIFKSVLGESILPPIEIMVTPDIDENYWSFRVKVSENQAVVAFPKFGTVGIGFHKEEDWNTNLPFDCEDKEIYNHIKHNAGEKIPKKRVVEAIRILKFAIKNMKENMN